MTAQIRVRDNGGTLRTVARIRVRDETGALRTVQRVRMRDTSNTLRTVFQYFQVSISPSTISQSGTTSTITTSTYAVVTATGGTAPLSYLWSLVAGDFISPTSPLSASTAFRKTGAAVESDYVATFVCTVTDALGNELTTDPIDVTISRT